MNKEEIISRMQQAKLPTLKETASTKKCKITSKPNTSNQNVQTTLNSSVQLSSHSGKANAVSRDRRIQKRRKRIKEDFSQNLIPVKSITGGMVLTTNNTYVKILEILPINFDNLSNKEKNTVIDNFYKYRIVAPNFVHLKSFTAQTDISDLISNINYTCTQNKSIKFRASVEDYIAHLRSLSTKQTITKRYFLIFQYEPKNRTSALSDINQIYDQIQGHVREAIRSFANMGHLILEHKDENLFQAEVLYQFFNRKTSRTETLNERIFRISSDAKMYYESLGLKQYGDIDIRSFLAPKGCNFKHPDYYRMDGLYYTHVILTAEGHPYNTCGGWLNLFERNGIGNIDIDIITKKLDQMLTKELVERTLVRKGVSAKNATKETDQDDYINSANNNKYIFDMLKAGEEIFDCCIIFTLFADSVAELNTQKEALLSDIKRNGMYAVDCFTLCMNCLKMTMPLTMLDLKVWSKPYKRNYLSSSFSMLYMFTAYQLLDPTGFLLGLNMQNASLCVTNLFNTKFYNNANMVITGVSGAGKTFTLLYIGRAMRFAGMRVFYILPEKGYEHKRACDEIDGNYIKVGPMEKTCINIMEIRPEAAFDASVMDDNIDIPAGCLLAKKISELSVFIQLLMGKTEMTIEENNKFDVAMTELYADFGITSDNQSIYDKSGKLKTMPIISDMYDKLLQHGMKRLAAVLTPFISGTCSNMNGQTNVNVDNEYTVFDVDKQSIGEKLLAAFLFVVLTCVYSIVRSSRLENAVAIIDELWRLLVKESSAMQVVEMVKLFRGYGGGVITATQEVTDLLGEKNREYGRAIFNNSASKLILHLEDTELDYVSSVMELSEDDKKMIKTFERGQGLFISKNEKIPLLLAASEKMIADFTTDPNLLRQMRSGTKISAT